MAVLEFVVPGPPRPKQRPRFANGRAYTPKDTLEYEAKVRECAERAMVEQEWEPEECDYRVQVAVFRAAKRGDLDNLVKPILDGMNKVVYPDDRMVRSMYLQMFDDKEYPRVEVKVFK